MRRHSPRPRYDSPPRRDYGGRGRSPPPRRGYGGGGGGGRGRGRGRGGRRDNPGSLLVRNIPIDCRPDELRIPFERFGAVRDVYIPKDYYTGSLDFEDLFSHCPRVPLQSHLANLNDRLYELVEPKFIQPRTGEWFLIRQCSAGCCLHFDFLFTCNGYIGLKLKNKPQAPHFDEDLLEPRGFAFVQFVDPYAASEAQLDMNGRIFAGREISVVVALETRKRPEEMQHRDRVREPYEGRQSRYGSRSPSRSPRRPHGSRSRYRSRSYSPAPRRRGDYSGSPARKHADYSRSPRAPPSPRDGDRDRRSYSPPGYRNAADQDQNGNGYGKRRVYEPDETGAQWRSPTRRASRSPSPSRSRSRSPDK
ncbi:hypothetical protein ACFE04_000447 [Oxalis oulophora]